MIHERHPDVHSLPSLRGSLHREEGVAVIMVLIILMLMSVLAVGFMISVRNHVDVAESFRRHSLVDNAVFSAEQHAIGMLHDHYGNASEAFTSHQVDQSWRTEFAPTATPANTFENAQDVWSHIDGYRLMDVGFHGGGLTAIRSKLTRTEYDNIHANAKYLVEDQFGGIAATEAELDKPMAERVFDPASSVEMFRREYLTHDGKAKWNPVTYYSAQGEDLGPGAESDPKASFVVQYGVGIIDLSGRILANRAITTPTGGRIDPGYQITKSGTQIPGMSYTYYDDTSEALKGGEYMVNPAVMSRKGTDNAWTYYDQENAAGSAVERLTHVMTENPGFSYHYSAEDTQTKLELVGHFFYQALDTTSTDPDTGIFEGYTLSGTQGKTPETTEIDLPLGMSSNIVSQTKYLRKQRLSNRLNIQGMEYGWDLFNWGQLIQGFTQNQKLAAGARTPFLHEFDEMYLATNSPDNKNWWLSGTFTVSNRTLDTRTIDNRPIRYTGDFGVFKSGLHKWIPASQFDAYTDFDVTDPASRPPTNPVGFSNHGGLALMDRILATQTRNFKSSDCPAWDYVHLFTPFGNAFAPNGKMEEDPASDRPGPPCQWTINGLTAPDKVLEAAIVAMDEIIAFEERHQKEGSRYTWVRHKKWSDPVVDPGDGSITQNLIRDGAGLPVDVDESDWSHQKLTSDQDAKNLIPTLRAHVLSGDTSSPDPRLDALLRGTHYIRVQRMKSRFFRVAVHARFFDLRKSQPLAEKRVDFVYHVDADPTAHGLKDSYIMYYNVAHDPRSFDY